MSVSSIPDRTKFILWGKAAGRCQYQGCNQPLWFDETTKAEFNSAYIAHIIADSPNGPRGDEKLSEVLKADISNLMLLCDKHHRRIDIADVEGHPVQLLRDMKQAHEERIELLTSIQPNRQSEILLFGATIGEHDSPLSFQRAAHGMLPEWYPASRYPIELGMTNASLRDGESDYWHIQSTNLQRQFQEKVRPRLGSGTLPHLSVFALAPQPLLILLGSMLTDIPEAQVYHLFREPPDWRWREHPDDFKLQVVRPTSTDGLPALVFALTATVNEDRILRVLGKGVSVWTITVPQPAHDAVPSKQALSEFRQIVRRVLDEIKAIYGEDTPLHVFPAMGVSLAVELGRVLQPKADMPLHVYDQQKASGFVSALDIPFTGALGRTEP